MASLLTLTCSAAVWLGVLVGFTLAGALSAIAGDDAETASPSSEPVPLHRQIDRLVEESAIGSLAEICSDADFVRRIYLDLTGVIPDAERVQSFLNDPSPDKRADLIDSLLEGPEFNRHFAMQLNVLLLERQSDKHVDQKAWETYLVDAVARRKPVDQIFQELIYPDELERPDAAARKFLLNREAEPHAMTRDVGRLLFGMDLQCAQCHDHPLVDDYLQSDYYGLYAFLHRTGLFVDPKSKVAKLAEEAEGEAAYESVFTGDGRKATQPRVPKGLTVSSEPSFPEDEAYRVKPEKTAAGKPRYSRRQRLAEMLAESELFRRNVANRLWGLLLGRGLVHPADAHSLANPPAQPALLALLADDWAAHDFDLRYAVREIVLSRVYQRSCGPPPAETINFADLRAREQALSQQRERWSTKVAEWKSAALAAEDEWLDAQEINDEVAARLPELESQLAEARTAAEQAEAERNQVQQSLDELQDRAKQIEAVLKAAATASEQFSDEAALSEVVATLDPRANELASEMKEAQSDLEQKTEAEMQARQLVDSRQSELETLTARRVDAEKLSELEQAHLAAAARWADGEAGRKRLDADLELCGQLAEYRRLADEDPGRAETVWQSVVERWTAMGQVAPLKPLTPEQMATSIMRATGVLAKQQTAAEAAVEKSPPEVLEDEDLADTERAMIRQVAIQQAWLNQVRGKVDQFVTHYGGLPGEEFQATVNQALFLGNSSTISDWLQPSGATLVQRLTKIESPDELADQLSLAVLSRPATHEERQRVKDYLAENATEEEPEQRGSMIAELVWALVSSAEFRFNH